MTAAAPTAVAPATIGRRVGAYAIDMAIAYLVVLVVAAIAMGIVFAVGAGSDPTTLALLVMGVTWGVLLPAAIGWALVYTAMQGGKGSIGQRMLRLRLYDEAAATPIGFGRALLRNIVWYLSLTIVVGYFTPLFDPSVRRQGWHDKAAHAVVGDRRATLASAAVESPAAPVEMPAPTAPSYALPVVPPPPPRFPSAAGGASARPAPTVAAMISHVPGVTQDPIQKPEPESEPAPRSVAPVAVVPSAAELRPTPQDPPAPLAAPADDVEATRAAASVPPPAQRAALYPDAPVIAVINWDDGTRMAVYGRTVYGRNPAAEEGAVSVAVRDETLSLSKTHFEIGGDPSGAWVADRHSTNGTVLVRDGGRHALAAGVQTPLRPGDRLEFGDRSAAVGSGS